MYSLHFQINITTSNGYGETDIAINIDIIPGNFFTPQFSQSTYTSTEMEDILNGSTVLITTAVDADFNEKLTYTILSKYLSRV